MYPRSSKVHEKNAQETFVSLDPRKHLYPFSVRYICIHISAVLTPTEFRFGGPIANILQITTGMLLYSCLRCVFLYRLSKSSVRFSHTFSHGFLNMSLSKNHKKKIFLPLWRQVFSYYQSPKIKIQKRFEFFSNSNFSPFLTRFLQLIA